MMLAIKVGSIWIVYEHHSSEVECLGNLDMLDYIVRVPF